MNYLDDIPSYVYMDKENWLDIDIILTKSYRRNIIILDLTSLYDYLPFNVNIRKKYFKYVPGSELLSFVNYLFNNIPDFLYCYISSGGDKNILYEVVLDSIEVIPGYIKFMENIDLSIRTDVLATSIIEYIGMLTTKVFNLFKPYGDKIVISLTDDAIDAGDDMNVLNKLTDIKFITSGTMYCVIYQYVKRVQYEQNNNNRWQ